MAEVHIAIMRLERREVFNDRVPFRAARAAN